MSALDCNTRIKERRFEPEPARHAPVDASRGLNHVDVGLADRLGELADRYLSLVHEGADSVDKLRRPLRGEDDQQHEGDNELSVPAHSHSFP